MPTIEGLTADEFLAMSDEDLDVLILSGDAIAFHSGTAEILGRFERLDDRLVMELGHIEGGGEGVLPSLYALAHRYARSRQLAHVEWRVHALSCAKPNLRLREILERRGFVVKDVPDAGEVYWKLDLVSGR